MENEPYDDTSDVFGFYERLEGPLLPHEAGDSYCKKFCNKPTDDAIHDYEDPEEFGF